MNQEFLMYRGYPLVRSGTQIYYGSMSEPYVVMMEITQQHQTEDGISVADKIRVYQIATREQNPMKAVKKNSERNSLYAALDLAGAWLKHGDSAEK